MLGCDKAGKYWCSLILNHTSGTFDVGATGTFDHRTGAGTFDQEMLVQLVLLTTDIYDAGTFVQEMLVQMVLLTTELVLVLLIGKS